MASILDVEPKVPGGENLFMVSHQIPSAAAHATLMTQTLMTERQ